MSPQLWCILLQCCIFLVYLTFCGNCIRFPGISQVIPSSPKTGSRYAEDLVRARHSMDKYRQRLYQDFIHSLSKFAQRQNLTEADIEKKLEVYRLKIDLLYTNISSTLNVQKNTLNEIGTKFIRPTSLDRSFDDFKRFYNESVMQAWLNSITEKPRSTKVLVDLKDLPLHEQLEILNKKLTESWDQLVTSSKDTKRLTEMVVQNSTKELIKFHRDLLRNAKLIEDTALEMLPNALSKSELKQLVKDLDSQLKKLEKDSNLWIEERLQEFDVILRRLQDRMKLNERIYEEVLGKKKSALQYTIMNDMTMNKVLQMIDEKDQGKLECKTFLIDHPGTYIIFNSFRLGPCQSRRRPKSISKVHEF